MSKTLTPIKWIKFRIACLGGFFVIVLMAILARSYQLHVLGNARVDRLANRQYKATLPVQPKRGTIYDRNGEVLAQDVKVSSISIHPHQIENKEEVINQLSSILNLPKSKMAEKVNSDKKFQWVARRVSSEQGTKIEALKLKGVSIVPEYRRFYPNGELAGNVLGAVGYDAIALGGVEMELDTYLKSKAQNLEAQKDARGKLYTPLVSEEGYHDVYLTIDRNIQFFTEKYLWENAEKYKVKHGFAIVMAPKTGEILAMANYPKFDPNKYWDYPLEHWKNHAIVASYEPGSTFKAVLAAAALRTGKVKSNDVYFCENGSYKIGKRVIHDHEKYGNMTVAEIMKVSSNIGVTKIANKIGKTFFYDTLKNLGFGKKTGVGLPGEDPGRLSPAEKWADIDFSNIAFGQGVAVNGIQMARAYAAFANGGHVMKPYFVSRITNIDNETVVENEPEAIDEILTEDQAKDLTSMLEGTVLEGGTGTLANTGGYTVAGKTGTAQKVNPVTKTYDEHDFVSSFIGYVPSKAPEFVIYVVYDSPQPQHYGGVVAASVFKHVAEEALAYRGTVPDKKVVVAASRDEKRNES